MKKSIIYWKGIRANIGLMFQIPKQNTIYILDLGTDRRSLIHTFFCFRPIDIVLINSKLEMVGKYYKVYPFRAIFPKTSFRFIIEGVDLNDIDLKFAKEYILDVL